MESSKTKRTEALKSFAISKSGMQGVWDPSGHTIEGRRNVGCGIAHSTRMSHIRNFAPSTFHPDVSHSEFCSADIPPGCLTSGILLCRHSIRIFRIRRLMPDGRRGRFNFPGQTYPDPLIALTRRVSQPFCTVPRCSPKASRYLQPTFWDILL